MQRIYLDNAATSPMHPDVIQTMTEAMQDVFGNPSAVNYHGRQAKGLLEKSRQIMIDSLHGNQASEIIFTSGGTESDNTAIIQTAFKRQHLGKHLITTQIEHEAVLQAMAYLAENGFEITYLPVDKNGQIKLSDLQAALRDDTILVSIMAANNEVGSVMPLAEIGQIVQPTNAWFHTDAVQAYGILPLDVNACHIDLLSVSAHKIGGPKLLGFLYQRQGCEFGSYLKGGQQEQKRRAGTQNVPAIAGFAKAVELVQEKQAQQVEKYQNLKQILLATLVKQGVEFEVNGLYNQGELPQIINLWFKGCDSTKLLTNLDLAGISVSAGSACSAGTLEASYVLQAMFADATRAHESLRFSFGFATTKTEVKQAATTLSQIIKRIKK